MLQSLYGQPEGDMFRAFLEKLVDGCEGAVGGVVMGFDGVAIDAISRKSDLDVKTISMEFSFVLTQVRKAAEILEVGALEEVSIHSAQLVFLVRVLSDEYFVALVLGDGGNVGKGRFLLRMGLPVLRAEVL